MKINIKQKIVSTVFAVMLLLIGFSPKVSLVGIIAVTISGLFFIAALSDS